MHDSLPLLATMALTAVIVLAAVASPAGAGVAFSILAAVGILAVIKGWWRRAYVITILAMFAGASNIDALAAVGGPLKMAALGSLLVVTLVETAGKAAEYYNGIHKAAMRILWLTVVYALVSFIWSVSRVETLIEGLTFAGFVLLLQRVSTVRWKDRGAMMGDLSAVYWTFFVMLAAGQVMAAFGMFEAISDFSGRQQGILNNPNLLGMLAAITFALGIGVAARRRSAITWASLLIPASQVVLSQSRTAMIAVTVAVVVVVVKGSLARLVAALAISLVGFLFIQASGVDLLGDSMDRFTANEGGDVLNARGDVWGEVFERLAVNPLGVGWAASQIALEALHAAGLGVGIFSVHNSYLQMLYELGWAGLLPVVLVSGLLLVVIIKAPAKDFAAGLTATIVAGVAIQFTESAIFGVGQPYPYLFWFAVLAAVLSIKPKSKDDQEKIRSFPLEAADLSQQSASVGAGGPVN
ncbi:O-antigen ligase [uncultured Citricoccus sp.]|uniref:O-antigen ligase family protein n=1 Tax=uncultured Citricoccus sp. TaxID=614031 RepID=UPI00261CD921|nr:O-antigen ligase family protein [uncultured Citricoccus sp.]